MAQSSDWGDDTNKQFEVEVDMQETDVELRAGVTAKVEILIERLEDVLVVPLHAVLAEGEDYACFVQEDLGFRRQTVEIGANNAHYVEIRSGLSEGDPVLLYDPRDEGQRERRSESPNGGGAGSDGESAGPAPVE